MGAACSVCGVKPIKGRGMCNTHYLRTVRYGDPHARMRVASGEVAAWMYANATVQTDECVFWPFTLPEHGRPTVNFDGFKTSAARAMCEIAHGPPPFANADAAHSCGNGHLACLSVNHLRWATRQENCDDAVAHGRTTRGERNMHAKLTNEQALSIFHDRRRYAAIAREYEVSQQTVFDIKRGRSWRWLTSQEKLAG